MDLLRDALDLGAGERAFTNASSVCVCRMASFRETGDTERLLALGEDM